MSNLVKYNNKQVDLNKIGLKEAWKLRDQIGKVAEVIDEFIDSEIRRLAAEGWTQARIAQECGCSQSTIDRRMKRLGIEANDPRGRGRTFTRPGKNVIETEPEDIEELEEEEDVDDEEEDEEPDDEELDDEEEEETNGYYEKDTSDWRTSLPDWETLLVRLTNTADRIESQLLAIEDEEEREECAEHLAHHILWAKSMIKRLKT